MITTSDFYGRAVDIPTGSSTYTHGSHLQARVLRGAWTSGTPTIILPTDAPDGVHLFFVLNDGSVDITVDGGATNATVVPGAAAEVHQHDSTYRFDLKTFS